MKKLTESKKNRILEEAKIKKKILMISDDFCEHSFETLKKLMKNGNYFYNPESNYFSFEVDLVEDFEEFKDQAYLRNYDAFLIDYGILGNEEDHLEIIKKMTENFGCVIWCGGLNGHYCKDAKELFPDRKYLHNLPECSIASDDIIYCLYQNLESNKAPQQFALRAIKIAWERAQEVKK